jgi:hypothetical protein
MHTVCRVRFGCPLFACPLLLSFVLIASAPDLSAQSRDLGARRLIIDDNAGHTVTLQTPAAPMPGSSVYTFPYVGPTANVILSEGDQTINGSLDLTGDLTSLGSVRAFSLTLTDPIGGLILGSGNNATTLTSTATSPRSINLPDGSGTLMLADGLNGFLPLSGGTMTGPIDMGSQAITNASTVSATSLSATSAVTVGDDLRGKGQNKFAAVEELVGTATPTEVFTINNDNIDATSVIVITAARSSAGSYFVFHLESQSPGSFSVRFSAPLSNGETVALSYLVIN